MMDITAKVKDVRKDTAKNGKPFYKVFLDSGEVLFAWDFNKIRNVKRGLEHHFIISKSQKGNFLNIEATEMGGQSEPEPWDEVPQDENDAVEEAEVQEIQEDREAESKDAYWARKDDRIGRMAALNTAVEYANYSARDGKVDYVPLTEEEIIGIAQRFEEYARTGK